MNADQQEAFTAAVRGHNALIIGQAGTGKTFLMKAIVQELKTRRKIALLCTTGMATLQYFELGATTVHSWAGLYDGRYDSLTLRDLVLNDDKYNQVRERVRNVDVIVIDEVSMLSARDFDQLDLVCRTARGNDIVFGGVQLLLSGDFYQLPPVGNSLYGDPGLFCFESDVFSKAVTHRFNLTQVVRQEEPILIRAVRETALGGVSPTVDEFLKSLEKEPAPATNMVHLFALNVDAAIFNNSCLSKLETPSKVYKAQTNSGSNKFLKRILAPHYLNLKIECEVLLLVNLGGKLVNGLRGKVTQLEDDVVHVYFPDIKQTHAIERHLFTVYSPTTRSNLAERKQFPLILAYGLTIHKAQGMTLESVHVHCGGIFQAGQLSVAIGRVTSIAGLTLTSYRKGLCFQPKPVVTSFYGKPFLTVEDDVSCCRNAIIKNVEMCEEIQFESDDSDIDTADIENIEQIDFAGVPDFIDVKEMLTDCVIVKPVTVKQEKINGILSMLNVEKLQTFVSSEHQRIEGLLVEEIPSTEVKTTPKQWTTILSRHHLYVTSEEYLAKVKKLFSPTVVTDDHVHISTKFVMYILKKNTENLARQVQIQATPQSEPASMSDAGKAKVRYVAGMCVAKVKQHHINILTSNLGNPEKQAQNKVKLALKKQELLRSMIADADMIDTETDKTLEEIERKQNVQKALTYVTDQTFQFFLHLNNKVQKSLTMQNLESEKEELFAVLNSEVEKDEDLNMLFCEIFQDSSEPELVHEIFCEITLKFMMVCQKQFLKDTKDKLSVMKKKSAQTRNSEEKR